MWITLSLLTPSRAGIGSFAATSVLCVCMTPLGSPVVPEVKISRVTSFGSGRSALSASRVRWRCFACAKNVSQETVPAASLPLSLPWLSLPSTTITWRRSGRVLLSFAIIPG